MVSTGNTKDLFITEADFLYASDELKKYEDRLNSVIKEYINILQYILMHGINDKLTNTNIINIISQVEKYPDMLEDSVIEARRIIEHFLQNINLADNFKY